MTRTVRINRHRLWASLMESMQIGAHDEKVTWLRGVRPLALTDAEARRRCGVIQNVLAATADDLGLPYVRGAGHDEQEISAICPAAMVFVVGKKGGISHTPREHSTPDACANGTDVLANAGVRLADQR